MRDKRKELDMSIELTIKEMLQERIKHLEYTVEQTLILIEKLKEVLEDFNTGGKC